MALKTRVYLVFLLLICGQQPISCFSFRPTMPVSTTDFTAFCTRLIDGIQNHPYLTGCLVTVSWILYSVIKFNRKKIAREQTKKNVSKAENVSKAKSDSPDLQARERILSSYLSKIKVDPLVTVKKLAELTPLAYPDELRYLIELADHFQQEDDLANKSQKPSCISPEAFLVALEQNRANKVTAIITEQIRQQDTSVKTMCKGIRTLEKFNCLIDCSAENIIDSVKHIPHFEIKEIVIKTITIYKDTYQDGPPRKPTNVTPCLIQAIAELDLSWENRKKRQFVRDCCIMYNLPALSPTITFPTKKLSEIMDFMKKCAFDKQHNKPQQLLLTYPEK